MAGLEFDAVVQTGRGDGTFRLGLTQALAYTRRKEFARWVAGAKRPEAVEMIAAGERLS